MVFSAVVSANLFNGLNTAVWTGWVFFAIFIGIILILIYTVRLSVFEQARIADRKQAIYNIISPGWFYVPV